MNTRNKYAPSLLHEHADGTYHGMRILVARHANNGRITQCLGCGFRDMSAKDCPINYA